MIIGERYDTKRLVKPNVIARKGGEIYQKTSSGVGPAFSAFTAIMIDLFAIGMPLDLMILTADPNVIGALVIMAPFIIATLGLFITCGVVAYARLTSKAVYSDYYGRVRDDRIGELSNIHDLYFSIPGRFRSPLMKDMFNKLQVTDDPNFDRRADKFRKVVNLELEQRKKINASVSDSDLYEADALLEQSGINPITGRAIRQ